jgi:hypothetical protein
LVAPVQTNSAGLCPYYATTINRRLRLRKGLQRSRVCEQRFIPGSVLIQQQLKDSVFCQQNVDLPTEKPPKSRRIA